MKILNYYTWYLFFSTLMQAVWGYTCPNISEINKKIDANSPMRFPLFAGENDRPFWRLINDNKKIEKYYLSESEATSIGGIYYQKAVQGLKSSLTCVYKNSQSSYFALIAAKKRIREVNSSSITEGNNWVRFYRNGLYACGGYNDQSKESVAERCEFSLQVSR